MNIENKNINIISINQEYNNNDDNINLDNELNKNDLN
jgi:hypothetical protein